MAQVLDVFPVRVGLVAAEPMTDREVMFYERLVEGITGEVCSMSTRRHPPSTLSPARIQARPEVVADEVMSAGERVDPNATAVVLDLSLHTADNFRDDRGLYRGSVWAHLAAAIDKLLTKWSLVSAKRQVVALFDDIPADGEIIRTVLEPHLRAGRLAFADVAGALVTSLTEEHTADMAMVRTALRTAAARSDLDLLRRKLICRLGWFTPSHATSGDRYVRYYYDCRLAREELTRLLESYVEDLDEAPQAIAYDASGCVWLDTPTRAAAEGLELPWIEVSSGASSLPEASLADSGIVLVVPGVQTGRSLQQALIKALDRELRVRRVIAVLATDGLDEVLGRLGSPIANSSVEVDYLVRVDQIAVDATDVTARKRSRSVGALTFDEAGRDTRTTLTSYEYWDLVRHVGLKSEEDVPADRRSLGLVPDFPRMMSQFGTWLAHNLAQHVEEAVGQSLADVLFVRPAHERGSASLSEYLELVAGARVVAIERDVFDSYRLRRGLALATDSDLSRRRDAWFLKLRSRSVDSLVYLDEFIASGTTLTDVIELGKRLGFGVSMAACLADFGSELVRPVPVRSLYRLQRSELRPLGAPQAQSATID